MDEIGIFFATCTNRTAGVAEDLAERLGVDPRHLHDVHDCSPSDLLRYRCIVAGSPTWERAALPRDWLRLVRKLPELDLSGHSVAVFGLGDAIGYPSSFIDAVGLLHDAFTAVGARSLGWWPTAGYRFQLSLAQRGSDRFCGLALDCDNEDERTAERLDAWAAQLTQELQAA